MDRFNLLYCCLTARRCSDWSCSPQCSLQIDFTCIFNDKPKHILRLRVHTVCNRKKSYFSFKTYGVDTQKNRLKETVLLSTNNIMIKIMSKKIFTILRWNFCLPKPAVINLIK